MSAKKNSYFRRKTYPTLLSPILFRREVGWVVVKQIYYIYMEEKGRKKGEKEVMGKIKNVLWSTKRIVKKGGITVERFIELTDHREGKK